MLPQRRPCVRLRAVFQNYDNFVVHLNEARAVSTPFSSVGVRSCRHPEHNGIATDCEVTLNDSRWFVFNPATKAENTMLYLRIIDNELHRNGICLFFGDNTAFSW